MMETYIYASVREEAVRSCGKCAKLLRAEFSPMLASRSESASCDFCADTVTATAAAELGTRRFCVEKDEEGRFLVYVAGVLKFITSDPVEALEFITACQDLARLMANSPSLPFDSVELR